MVIQICGFNVRGFASSPLRRNLTLRLHARACGTDTKGDDVFTETIEAIRGGASRAKRRAALARDLERDEALALDETLEDLERREAEDAAKRERREAERLADERRAGQLAAAEGRIAEDAAKIDALLAELEAAFTRIEADMREARDCGGADRNVNTRRWLLVNAAWFHARTFSARLGIARSPGGVRKWSPLSEALEVRKGPLDE